MACDSGPVHLAAAQGIPALVLFGPTSTVRWAPPPARARPQPPARVPALLQPRRRALPARPPRLPGPARGGRPCWPRRGSCWRDARLERAWWTGAPAGLQRLALAPLWPAEALFRGAVWLRGLGLPPALVPRGHRAGAGDLGRQRRGGRRRQDAGDAGHRHPAGGPRAARRHPLPRLRRGPDRPARWWPTASGCCSRPRRAATSRCCWRGACRGSGCCAGPGAPSWPRWRPAASGANALLLDDGFQHRALARDLDVVVLDAANPFGNGHLMPVGPNREPRRALDRAGLVWLSRVDQAAPELLERLRVLAFRHTGRGPVESRHAPLDLLDGSLGRSRGLAAARGKRVLLLSGLARPGAFRRTVEGLGAEVVARAAPPRSPPLHRRRPRRGPVGRRRGPGRADPHHREGRGAAAAGVGRRAPAGGGAHRGRARGRRRRAAGRAGGRAGRRQSTGAGSPAMNFAARPARANPAPHPGGLRQLPRLARLDAPHPAPGGAGQPAAGLPREDRGRAAGHRPGQLRPPRPDDPRLPARADACRPRSWTGIFVYEGWENLDGGRRAGPAGSSPAPPTSATSTCWPSAHTRRGVPITHDLAGHGEQPLQRPAAAGAAALRRRGPGRRARARPCAPAIRALQEGRVLGYVYDQNQLGRAIFPTFFGVPAATTADPGLPGPPHRRRGGLRRLGAARRRPPPGGDRGAARPARHRRPGRRRPGLHADCSTTSWRPGSGAIRSAGTGSTGGGRRGRRRRRRRRQGRRAAPELTPHGPRGREPRCPRTADPR